MRTTLPFFTLAVLAASCGNNDNNMTDGGSDAGMMGPIVEIRADTNRNGKIDWTDPTEATNKDKWDAKHGAIFLANIDDDQSMCPKKDANGALLSDIELAKCNDAADTVVNGDDDLIDMAPLETKPFPNAPADAVGKIEISDPGAGFVHLFKLGADGTYAFFDQTTETLSNAEIKAGVKLRIEGTDIVRDKAVWDGNIVVSYKIGDKTDKVAMRIAPLIARHHLDQEKHVYYTRFASQDSTAFTSSLKSGMTNVIGSLPPDFVYEINASEKFGSSAPFQDQWTQDYFETGYMSMPVADGKQHVIDTYIRSANVYAPKNPNNMLRPAGKVVWLKFRGPDAAAIQQFDIPNHDGSSDSLNSFGNLETIPPYDKYPLGRIFRGNISSFGPDPSFLTMMESQNMQPAVYVDTSWLLVGHVDETVSFVKAPSPRGWTILVNDARLAKTMLEDEVKNGNGSVVMFENQFWDPKTPAQVTINQVLADTNVMNASATAAAKVDSQLKILKTETGITDQEIVKIPFLHQDYMGYSVAYQPGMVNGLSFAQDGFAAPDPHGPVINGKDIFKVAVETALGKLGIKVAWIEDWDLYHALDGEVHCGSNSLRAVPDTEKWWESGY